MTRPRDSYGDVGTHLRATIEAATNARLTPTESAVLLAVIHYTASRSRIGDHVWTGQLADLAFAIDVAAPWQIDKTRKALAGLRRKGIIDAIPPRGRTTHADYWVALTGPGTSADTGLPSEDTRSANGGPPSNGTRSAATSPPSTNGRSAATDPPSRATRSASTGREGRPAAAGKVGQRRPGRSASAGPPTEVSRGSTEGYRGHPRSGAGAQGAGPQRGARRRSKVARPADITVTTPAEFDALDIGTLNPGDTITAPSGTRYTVTTDHELEEIPT